MQHAAAGPLFGGKLGDELRGKNEIEIAEFSLSRIIPAGRAQCGSNNFASCRRPIFSVIIALAERNASQIAGMAELVDARDSKSRDREIMGVRFPLPAPRSNFPTYHPTS